MATSNRAELVRLAAQAETPDPNNMRPKIIEAATDCFARFGIKKTTIDDISKAAGVSRPTFYRFFENKQDLLLSIAIEEIQRLVGKSIRHREKIKDIDQLFVETILDMILECQKSDVVQFLLSPENEDMMVQITEAANEHWQVQTLGWKPLLDQAKAEGRFRDNVSFSDIAHWITTLETMFIIRSRAVKLTAKELRALITRFVVPSILKDK